MKGRRANAPGDDQSADTFYMVLLFSWPHIVLNNQEAQGRYDPSKLAELLEELPELAMTGFDDTTLATLHLEPAAIEPAEELDANRVEITLVMDAATYGKLAPRLEDVGGEFDLVTHVKRGPLAASR